MDQIWQIFYDYRVEFIIAFVIALIIIIITTPLRNLFRKLWELIFPPADEKKEQDRKLRIHFEDLKNEVINPLVSVIDKLQNSYGELVFEGFPDPFNLHFDFQSKDLFYRSFFFHFPKITYEWEELAEEIREHNKRFSNFIEEFKTAIRNKTKLSIDEGHFREEGALIFHDAAMNLWKYTMYDFARDLSLVLDLQEAKIEQVGDLFYLMSETGSVTYATSDTYQKLKELKSCFIGLTEQPRTIQRASEILEDGDLIISKFKSFKNRLNSISELYSKYRTLDRQEKCFICRQIFYKRKPRWKSLKSRSSARSR